MDMDNIIQLAQNFLTAYFCMEVFSKLVGLKDQIGGPFKKRNQ